SAPYRAAIRKARESARSGGESAVMGVSESEVAGNTIRPTRAAIAASPDFLFPSIRLSRPEGIFPIQLQYILEEAGFKPYFLLGRRLFDQGELHLRLFDLAFDDEGAVEIEFLESFRRGLLRVFLFRDGHGGFFFRATRGIQAG